MMTQLATPNDIAAAQAWLAARGLPVLPTDVFSSTGYVVPGVAAIWLYLTDSTLAFLDLMISNPSAPKAERRAALDAVVGRAIAEAKLAGARAVCANVERSDVEEIGVRHGMKTLGMVKMMSVNVMGEEG